MTRNTRSSLFEPLEERVLMATDWQNACNASDTSGDGIVSPVDALVPINRLNQEGAGPLPLPAPTDGPFYDANGNGSIEPADVLIVVNILNGEFNSYFTFLGELENDTAANGTTNDDGVTNDADVSARFTSLLGFREIEASLDGGSPVALSHTCGSFLFEPQLAVDGTDDGQHTVSFTARDPRGNAETFEVGFTLDTVAPTLAASLMRTDDSGLPGDGATTAVRVAIVGQTEPGRSVSVNGGSAATADANGDYVLSDVPLAAGVNSLTLQAADLAGNATTLVEAFTRTPCDFDDDQTEGTFHDHNLPSAGDAIPGFDVSDGTLPLATGSNGRVQRATGHLNQDFDVDLLTLSRSTDELLVYLGTPEGTLAAPVTFPSGADEPVAIAVGDFLGRPFPDVAIGHLDGRLTFLEGVGDGTFSPRSDLDIPGLGSIVDLSHDDFDNDGDLDLVVSGGDRITLLKNDNDPVTGSPIANGTFAEGLTGWTVEILGHPDDGLPGTITVGNGHVQLRENESFLVSIRQTFEIPPTPQEISFDIFGLHLESPAGGVPDAFEASLLDGGFNSLVATFGNNASSFFNANPGDSFGVGADTRFDGTTVTLDISQLTPGTEATLFFDLVGNQPGGGSTVSVGNVAITPDVVTNDTFTRQTLATLANSSGVGHCDANQDGIEDIVVEQDGDFVIFAGDGSGGFTQTANTSGPGRSARVPSYIFTGEGEAANRPITVGEVVNDSLDTPSETDVFTFAATAGQKLFFDAQNTSGFQVWALTDPSGGEVFNQGLTDREGVVIAATGTYALSINGFLGFGTGAYQFQIHDVPDPVSSPINLGQVVAGTIGTPGQEAEYTFSGTAGRTLYFDALEGISIFEWTLTSPSGSQVFQDAFVDQGRTVLTESGTYSLLMDGELDTTGNFQFQVNDVTSGPPTPIQFNEEVFSRLDVAGEVDRYSFTAASGQVVYLDAQFGSSQDLSVTLVDSGGTVQVDGPFEDIGPLTLQPGEHILTVAGQDDSRGDYGFLLWDVPADVPQTIQRELPVPGAIAIPGQTRSYEFNGTAGEEIVFDEIYGLLNHLQYTLRDPTGGVVFDSVTNDQVVASLPATGTYTLIAAGTGDGTGSFSFQIAGGNTPPPVPPAADLVVTRVDAPRRLVGSNATFEVEWEVANQGTVAVPAGTVITDRLHLSSDTRLDDLGTDPLLGEFETTLAVDLAPGESVSRRETIALSAGIDAEFQVTVHADAWNVVFEDQNESTGNVRGSLLAVYPEPRQLVGDPILALDNLDGAEFPAGATVTVSGSAVAEPGALNAIFMLDLSGSTAHITGLDANFDGATDALDDLNGDGRVGDLLDKEIGLVLHTVAQLDQRTPDLRVAIGAWTASGVALFDSGEPLDLGTERFNQTFYTPGRDHDANGVADLEEAVRSVSFRSQGSASHSGATEHRDFIIGSGNDFDEALHELLGIMDSAPDADQTQVYFFADGLFFPSEDQPADAATIAAVGARGVQFRAAQVAGPALVAQHCGGATPPAWCAQVDPGIDFVAETKRIVEGVAADPSSMADIVLAQGPEDLDNVPFTPVRVAGVTVNGRGVESLDAAGNFFSSVVLAPGDNLFTVEAIDSTGTTVQRQARLVGVEESPPDFDDFNDVTPLAEVSFAGTTFNRRTNTLHAQTVITNTGDQPLRGPIRVVFNRFDPAVVELSNPSRLDDQGRPVIDFNGEIPADGLAPGTSSAALPIDFANAPRDRFELDVTVLALGNTAPAFSSVPVTAATLGVEYRYAATATDAETDSLGFHLEVAPDGMQIDPVTGVVTWSPAPAQLGVHSITLGVEDGFGGSASQSFQLNLQENPPNRPPVFRSTPVTRINSGDDYSYQPDVRDTDGNALQFALAGAPAGMSIDTTTGQVDLAGPADGDYNVTIQVDDGAGGTAVQAFVLTVGDVVANPSAPLILSTPPTVAAVNEPFLYLPLAQDPDHDPLTFSLVNPPANMTIDAGSGRCGQRLIFAALRSGMNGVMSLLSHDEMVHDRCVDLVAAAVAAG